MMRNTSLTDSGFTLIETLAAVTLLIVAIISPMMLTERSLTSAYYARDQITASYLAQEAIEAVHQIRDNNILTIAKTVSAGSVDLFTGVPVTNDCDHPTYFTVDATKTNTTGTGVGYVIVTADCSLDPTACTSLKINNHLYGYGNEGWNDTNFNRLVSACYTDPNTKNEVHVTVVVSWKTSSLQTRTFTISENLYRWIQDGSGL